MMNKIKFYWDIFSPTMGIFVIAILMFFVIGLALSVPLCLLWNWLMPFIFGLPKLNLLQTFGLSILISLLSPRKIEFKKNKPNDNYNQKYDDVNEKLEEFFQNLSSQFRA